uniref:Uncharacterized protein n=1 Tax=Anguilla anguilla TaxID=7936 RepID=A0A0E9RDM9_ANGAN
MMNNMGGDDDLPEVDGAEDVRFLNYLIVFFFYRMCMHRGKDELLLHV